MRADFLSIRRAISAYVTLVSIRFGRDLDTLPRLRFGLFPFVLRHQAEANRRGTAVARSCETTLMSKV